jgi:hypothetical protein
MTAVAIVFCVITAVLGCLGLFSPPRFLDLIRRLTTLQGFYVLAVMRIAFGAALFLAAPDSRLPKILEIFAIVLIASGIVTPYFTHTRYRKVVEWWAAGGTLYVRIWAGCACLFALLLAYAILPPGLT